jgi:Gas vesicle synthesis protein GvpL/GvpF
VKRLIHAVIRVAEAIEAKPTLPERLNCLVSGGLAVAFSEVEIEALTPTVSRLEVFARDVAELHQHHTMIPFRFGCTLETDEQLVALLHDHRSAWLTALDQVEQCDEFSLHVLRRAAGPPTTVPSHATLEHATSDSAGAGPGTKYLLARRLSMERASALRKQALARGEEVCQALHGTYRNCQVEPGLPGHESVLTLVFLVPRASISAFLIAVERAANPAVDRLHVTGPWPPYHFAVSLSERIAPEEERGLCQP